SSEYYNAVKGNITYAANAFSTFINYEKVDPGYRTLGAYFFNNDLENITAGGSARLFENKLDLSASVGKQRNNLDDTEVSAMKRTIASVQVTFTPSEHWNINTTYS